MIIKCKSCKEELIKGDNQQHTNDNICVVCSDHINDYDNEYISYYK